MKDLIVPVNNEALSRALVAVVGPDTTKTIVDAYAAIDAAMNFGYERGVAAGDAMRKAAAEEYIAALERSGADNEANVKADFRKGYDAGFEDGKDHEAYSAGYGAGFDLGVETGAAEAIGNLKELTDEEAEKHYEAGTIAGRADGFKAGYGSYCADLTKSYEFSGQASYDDGYVDGVADARGWPQYADEQLARLCEADEFDDLEPKENACIEGEEYYPDDTIDHDFYFGNDWFKLSDIPNIS